MQQVLHSNGYIAECTNVKTIKKYKEYQRMDAKEVSDFIEGCKGDNWLLDRLHDSLTNTWVKIKLEYFGFVIKQNLVNQAAMRPTAPLYWNTMVTCEALWIPEHLHFS